MDKLNTLDIAKFWMNVKVDESTPLKYSHSECLGHCWIWKGSCLVSGYGRVQIKNKTHRAHRLSYYLINGTISKDKFICHKCDNPKCVNPKHLFEGTAKENAQDRDRKDRYVKRGKSSKRNVIVKKRKSSSEYYGVTFRLDSKKWRVRCKINGKNHLIGQFETELEAAKAYDSKVSILNLYLSENEKFILNFP